MDFYVIFEVKSTLLGDSFHNRCVVHLYFMKQHNFHQIHPCRMLVLDLSPHTYER